MKKTEYTTGCRCEQNINLGTTLVSIETYDRHKATAERVMRLICDAIEKLEQEG